MISINKSHGAMLISSRGANKGPRGGPIGPEGKAARGADSEPRRRPIGGPRGRSMRGPRGGRWQAKGPIFYNKLQKIQY